MDIRKLSIILFYVLFTGCYYNESTKVVFYYDNDKQKIKLTGVMKDDREYGKWTYYDTAQNILQEGVFYKGLQTDNWSYKYDSFNRDILWKACFDSLFKMEISLPSSFGKFQKMSSSMICSQDTNNNQIVITCIQPEKFEDESQLIDSYKNYRNSLIDNNILYESYSTKIILESNKYYYFNTFVINKNGNKEVLYILECVYNNRIINISYSCNYIDRIWVRSIFADIFHHIYFNNHRLIDPYENIKEFIQ